MNKIAQLPTQISIKKRLEPLCLAVMSLSLFCAAAGVFVLLFATNQEVRELRQHEASLLNLQETEQSEIDVLEVEIAYLTHPSRIEELARRHLQSSPPKPDVIYFLDEFISQEAKISIRPDQNTQAQNQTSPQ
ncbi:MAG: cell division protein FtsL [Alphaproteobacteria bacterium]